jgi:hypothetical protein
MRKRSFFKDLQEKLYGNRGPKVWETTDGKAFDRAEDAVRHAVHYKLRIKTYHKEL